MTIPTATRCPLCGVFRDERTAVKLDPERCVVVSATVCDACRVKSNAASLAAWLKLSPMEREGAATKTERGGE